MFTLTARLRTGESEGIEMEINLTAEQAELSVQALEFTEGAYGSFESDREALIQTLQSRCADVTPRQANLGLRAINNPSFVFSQMVESTSEEEFHTKGNNAIAIHEEYLRVILARVEELQHDYEAVVREITPPEAFEDHTVEEIAASLEVAHDQSATAEQASA